MYIMINMQWTNKFPDAFTEKAMFLNGMVFIFVYPNDDSIIAMRVENHEMKKIYKSQHLSNVTELKNVIPYYS